MILNLKELNTHVKYTKFKMDHIDKVVSLLRLHDVMASLDLISAYGQVHLDPHHQKFSIYVAGQILLLHNLTSRIFRFSPYVCTYYKSIDGSIT